MPSEYDKLAYDLDRDGHANVWEVPDALASAANQLKAKGWVTGVSWGYEVRLPQSVTCAQDGPEGMQPIANWSDRGVQRVRGKAFSDVQLMHGAFLFSPGGGFGPKFLATENFLVIKRYNTSDLYTLFVGHLADRIAGAPRFAAGWGPIKQLPAAQISEVQARLKAAGLAIGKVDGKVGPNTRSQIGQYQVKTGLPVDCWPTAKLLAHLRARQP